jgi:hypothetical protein
MALTDWDGPNKTGCCERLALFLQNEGLATFIQQRLYGGAARAYGLGFERNREEQVDEDLDNCRQISGLQIHSLGMACCLHGLQKD